MKKCRGALEWAPFFVFDKEAGVFYYQEAGGVGLCCGLRVRDSLLEPEGFGVDGDGGIGDGRDFFGTAEDIDDVDGEWDVFEARVGFLAQHFGFVGTHGDDLVAGALEVGGDFVGGAEGIRGEADNRDGFGLAEKGGDGFLCFRCAIGEMDLHGDWMMVSGNG